MQSKEDSKSKWPFFDKDEIEAVHAVLESGRVNAWTGEQVALFEQDFAKYIESKHAIAVSNGTTALELAIRGCGIDSGEIIVPARTFIATASAVVANGAVPVCADVDLNSQNITIDSIDACLTNKTKAIIVVHLAGYPADMAAICQYAKDKGLTVIEDCAQAHGARIQGRHVGTFGDVGTFSFCQDKIISTGGEGGMVVTNNQAMVEQMRSYKDHGKNFEKIAKIQGGSTFHYVHDQFGSNLRMTEMQAAIGIKQLQKLDSWHAKRTENAKILNDVFANEPAIRTVSIPDKFTHAYYKYYAFLNSERLKSNWSRTKIIAKINEQGVYCATGICPDISQELAFNRYQANANQEQLANTRALSLCSLMFMVHPTLTQDDMLSTAEVVQSVVREAS